MSSEQDRELLAFEDWYTRTGPYRNPQLIRRQWEESPEFADFIEADRAAAALAKGGEKA